MTKPTLHTLLLATLPLLTSCITEEDIESYSHVNAGDRLPEFSLVLNTGKTITTDSLRGKVSMLVFFNTNCNDCRVELPVVNAVASGFGDEINVVCISREEGEQEVSSYWQENSLTLPYSSQNDNSIYKMFATSGIPRIYIADKNLIVTYTFDDDPMPDKHTLTTAITASEPERTSREPL